MEAHASTPTLIIIKMATMHLGEQKGIEKCDWKLHIYMGKKKTRSLLSPHAQESTFNCIEDLDVRPVTLREKKK